MGGNESNSSSPYSELVSLQQTLTLPQDP
jgi:hypothetical protein